MVCLSARDQTVELIGRRMVCVMDRECGVSVRRMSN